jgi:hypothetical protein
MGGEEVDDWVVVPRGSGRLWMLVSAAGVLYSNKWLLHAALSHMSPTHKVVLMTACLLAPRLMRKIAPFI